MAYAERSLLALGPHGFHRIAYREWGAPDCDRVVVCVHGLTRNSHDFDVLAAALQERWRVVCPDLPGRGASDWLPDPALYDVPHYLGAMACLVARLGVEAVDWIGTSLGGLIGLVLAAQPNTPIRRLVLNDVGPFLPAGGLERLQRAMTVPQPEFASIVEAERWFRAAMATFGPLADEQWRAIAEHGIRPVSVGRWRLHFDPAIVAHFLSRPAEDVVLWPLWDRLACPVLAIRGADSDVLSAATVAEMQRRGPSCNELVVPHTGHAPMLMNADEVSAVVDWLGGDAPPGRADRARPAAS